MGHRPRRVFGHDAGVSRRGAVALTRESVGAGAYRSDLRRTNVDATASAAIGMSST